MTRTLLTAISILLAFVLGMSVMWGYQQTAQQKSQILDNNVYNELFDDSFFRQSRSPFDEMSRMQERMDRLFGSRSDWPAFDPWFKGRFGNFPSTGIRMEEGDDHVYYVLDVQDQAVANVDVSTSDGYVRITAKLTREDGGMASTMSLNQQFPVPANVDAGSVRVSHEGDEIRISFRKSVL